MENLFNQKVIITSKLIFVFLIIKMVYKYAYFFINKIFIFKRFY